MSTIIIGTFFAVALIGMPLAFALGFSALVALAHGNIDYNMLPQRMMHAINAFPLMAIPLFMLAGQLMIRGGIAEQLIQLANAFIGRVTGGLAQVAILAGAGMATVSGASVADASALASLLVRELKKVYGIGFSAAIVAVAGNLAAIIPPSNAMIVYAYMAGSSVSVAGLFLAGVVPGLLLTVGTMAITWVIAKRRGYPLTGEAISLHGITRELRRSWAVLLMPVIVLGGIIGGAFTATEGAAIAAHAGAMQSLEAFIKNARSGRAEFTQVITAPARQGQAARTKTSSGTFEFQRPNRFRFEYRKPFEQTIKSTREKMTRLRTLSM